MSSQPGSAGTAADQFRTPSPTVPVPREHADPAEPGRRTTGRHRSPPPAKPPPTAAWWVTAAAAGLLTVASVVEIGMSVAPHAAAAAPVTVTRAERTTAGPLEMPTVGVVAPAVESLYPTPSATPQRTAAVSRGIRTARTTLEAGSGDLVAITGTSEPTVTPAVQPATPEPAPEAASPDPETPAGDVPPTEETPTVTPTPVPETTVTVDVTGEVTVP